MSNYYLNNSTGSNSNNGLSTGTAWQTLNYALANIPAGQDHILNIVNTGISYDLGSSTVTIPNKISIKTYNADTTNSATWATIQGTLQTNGATSENNILWCLNFDGKNLAYAMALSLTGVCYLRYITIKNYLYRAMLLDQVTGNSRFPVSYIGDTSIKNCTYGNSNKPVGYTDAFSMAILTGDVKVRFFNLTVDCMDRGGQCTTKAKSGAQYYTLQFYNSNFLATGASWNNSPTISVEIQDCRAYKVTGDSTSYGVKISGCTFNSNVSLATQYNENNQSSIEVDHCFFNLSGGYPLETSSCNIHAHHNLMIGGSSNYGCYSFGNFDGSAFNYTGIQLDHNIIDNYASSNPGALNINGYMPSLKFINNTVVSRSGNYLAYFAHTEDSGNQFVNNIFYNATTSTGVNIGASVGFNNNLFKGFSTVGSNTSTSDPLLKQSSTDANTPAYYQLTSSSPAKGSGVAVSGFSETTDKGAVQYGSTPFSVGVGAVALPSDLILDPWSGATVGSSSSPTTTVEIIKTTGGVDTVTDTYTVSTTASSIQITVPVL